MTFANDIFIAYFSQQGRIMTDNRIGFILNVHPLSQRAKGCVENVCRGRKESSDRGVRIFG